MTGRRDELDPRPTQSALARRDARLLAYEAGHSGDDKQEEDRRGDDQNEHVGVAERLDEPNSRRDQTGAAEEREPQRCQTRTDLRSPLFERAHRRMQSCCAPEQVIENPTRVEDQLVVVRVVQERVVVGRVRGHEADDAADEEPERRRALAGIDREPDRGRKQKNVAERVRH